MRRARQPAGLRFASRSHRPANVSIAAAHRALVSTARLSLALDADDLRRLWERRGAGTVREYVDGSLSVVSPAGEVIIRGSAPAIADWLRSRLETPPAGFPNGTRPEKNEAVSIPPASPPQT